MGIKKLWLLSFICILGMTGCALELNADEEETNRNMTIKITVEDTQADTVSVQDTPLSDLSESDLLYLFGEKSNEPVLAHYYGDFDHDGIHEAFVITGDMLQGPVDSAETIYGKLWLVNSKSIQLAAEDFSGISDGIAIWNFENRDFLAASKTYVTGNHTYLWTVSQGMPKKESVSGLGDIRNEDGRLYVAQVTEDAMMEGNELKGQTIKYYDMYYDGFFREYGAIVITKERFLEYEGSEEILTKLETDYPDSRMEILYHDNDVIYINVEHQAEENTYYHSAIIKIADGVSSLQSVIEGKYEKALLKEIAVYPSRYGIYPDTGPAGLGDYSMNR